LIKFVGGVGEDIHEGKRTLMVIHTFNNAPETETKRLKEILSMKTSNTDHIKEAIGIMQKNNSMEFARDKASELMKDAWKEIDLLVTQSPAKTRLKALVDYLISRRI